MTGLEVIIFFILLGIGFTLSALWSGLETGMYVINPVRLTVRAARGDRQAVAIRRELAHPARLLAALLIATNASSYLASYSLAQLFHGLSLEGWTLIALETAVFTPLLFVFAETLPKDLFRTHSDIWSYRLARVLVVIRWILTVTLLLPIVQGITHLASLAFRSDVDETATARQRVLHMISEGLAVGVVSEWQTSLADRMLRLRERSVQDEMIPWSGVTTLKVNAPLATRRAWITLRHHTRFPVIDSDGQPCGVISMLDALLEPQAPTDQLMQPIFTCRQDMSVPAALAAMRHERQAMAVVTDASGKAVGMVTIKDLVEPLTGELHAW